MKTGRSRVYAYAMGALHTTPKLASRITLAQLIALGPLNPTVARTAEELAELIDAVECGLLMESGVYEISDYARAA